MELGELSEPQSNNTRAVQYRVILHGTGIEKYCCRNIYWIISHYHHRVPSYTEKNITRMLPLALLLMLHTSNNTDGSKLVIFSGIASYYGVIIGASLSEPIDNISLASQTHFRKRGKGLVNCVYKHCPTGMQLAG